MTKVWAVLLCGCALPLVAQVPVKRQLTVAAPLTAGTSNTLQQMAAQAGVIFAGHVVAVSFGNGYVETRFRIDQAVRGCPQTGTYLLREWDGLWTGEAPRFTVGERRLMLLYARNAAGMSSPVNGMEGAIPIVAAAVQPIANALGVAPAEDGSDAQVLAGMAVDLRWVQAAETRATTPLAGASSVGGDAAWVGPVAALEGQAIDAAGMAARPTVATVVALLGTVPAAPVKAYVAR